MSQSKKNLKVKKISTSTEKASSIINSYKYEKVKCSYR